LSLELYLTVRFRDTVEVGVRVSLDDSSLLDSFAAGAIMARMKTPSFKAAAATAAAISGLTWVMACGGGVNSKLQAEQSYQGLDQAVEKCITLGFAGFNSAGQGANIVPQSTDGGYSGTLTVSGKVDEGNSDNKNMTLDVEMTNYSDGEVTIGDNPPVAIAYQTQADAGLPVLDIQLKNIPDGNTTGTGTFGGTFIGKFLMDGDLEGTVELNLTMSGNIEGTGTGQVRRQDGTTTITGTAKSPSGEYQVDVTR